MKPKGIALLLHACTHDALKFFSSSPSQCSECVGLAEELRIVRLVQERGYVPVAVTCMNSKSGCWSESDLPRLQQVIRIFQEDLVHPSSSNKAPTNTTITTDLPVIAIGASSGGHMAAQAAAEGLVDAALVMVMGLQPKLQEKLLERKPPLYLAPMPRDQRTLKRNRENYEALVASNYNGNATIKSVASTVITTSSRRLRVILDETSCVPLPVTVDYLTERVPGLTHEPAALIILALQTGGHLDRKDSFFQKDPTVSGWREVLLALDDPSPTAQEVESDSAGAEKPPTEFLWGRFRLTRGQSPLAKAFHRSWAFHEYCSESVPLALDFFEEK